MCSDKVFITKKYIYFNLFLGGKTMVFEKIREIIAEQTGKDVDEITLETNVKEDLDADSLDLFELVMALEEEYGIEIPSEELESLTTGCS